MSCSAARFGSFVLDWSFSVNANSLKLDLDTVFEAAFEGKFDAVFDVLRLVLRILSRAVTDVVDVDLRLMLALVIRKSVLRFSSRFFRSSLSCRLVSENLRIVGVFFAGFGFGFIYLEREKYLIRVTKGHKMRYKYITIHKIVLQNVRNNTKKCIDHYVRCVIFNKS